MWPKLLHAENLEEDLCSCDSSASKLIFLGSFAEGSDRSTCIMAPSSGMWELKLCNSSEFQLEQSCQGDLW